MGADLTDDEFLLQLLILGVNAKKFAEKVAAAEKKKASAQPKRLAQPAAAQASGGMAMDFPMQFLVDVEGEEFNVTVRGLGGTDADASSAAEAGGSSAKRGNADAPGAVKPNMAGSTGFPSKSRRSRPSTPVIHWRPSRP